MQDFGLTLNSVQDANINLLENQTLDEYADNIFVTCENIDKISRVQIIKII